MLRTIEAGPVICASDVEALECRYGFRLPRVYREFLVARNGGRPERDLFGVPACKANPVARVHLFFGINDPIESCNLAWNIAVFGSRIPQGMIPIGTTEGVDKVCLVLDSGAIVYWDGHENVVFPVSTSFDEFIAALFRDELSPDTATR